MDPARTKAEIPRIEKFLNKLMEKPNPREEEFFIGDRPPNNDAYARGVIDRKSIVNIALTMTNRVSEEILIRVCDSMFNDGISIDALKEISALEISDNSLHEVQSVLESAKLIEDGPPVALEKVEAVVTISRAILRYLMTHHGENYSVSGKLKYEQGVKTPFKAWRVKEEIQEWLVKSEPILINKHGHDSKRQCDEFFASFNIADIVLWNNDIWQAAVRGYDQAFLNTQLSKDVVESIVPMFWQFDRHLTFVNPVYSFRGIGRCEDDSLDYECVGFSVMPHRENLVEVIVKDPDNNVKVTPDPKDPDHCFIDMDANNPDVREAIHDAYERIDKGEVVFGRHGISIGLIFMPNHDKLLPPEIRFIPAIFEDEEIKSHLTAIIIAAAKFLTLKYVAKDNVQVSKKELKADRKLFKAVRHGKVQAPPVKVINLRRAEKRHLTESEIAEHAKRNYNCWWMVDAHWRKQWFPSLNRHQQIRIFSYAKGDFTKNFKPSREKVYKAVR
jgi:hypothetical protein